MDQTEPAMPPAGTPNRPAPSRRTLWLILAPLVVLVIGAYVGDAIAPTLVDTHPLLLILLNARNRNLILVTNQLDTFSYYTVGTFRLLLSDPLFYLLGYLYGDAAVRWLERKSPSYGPMARSAERFFGKAGYPLIFIAPNNYICLFAGAAGMAIPVFLALNVAGTITRLYLIRRLGETFEEPIDRVLNFISDYRIPLVILSVVAVAFTIWYERRQGRSELDSLTHIDEATRSQDPVESDRETGSVRDRLDRE